MRAALMFCPILVFWSHPVAFEMAPPETDQARSERLSRTFSDVYKPWDPLDIVISDSDDCKPSFPEPIAGRVFCYDKGAKIYK